MTYAKFGKRKEAHLKKEFMKYSIPVFFASNIKKQLGAPHYIDAIPKKIYENSESYNGIL